jgi:hypothetical protein
MMENSEPINLEETLCNILALEIEDALNEEMIKEINHTLKGEKFVSNLIPFEGTEEEKAMIKATHDKARAWAKATGYKKPKH